MTPEPPKAIPPKEIHMNEATLRIPASRFNRQTRRKMAKNLRAKASIHTKKHTRGRLSAYGREVEPRVPRVKWYQL